MTTVAGGNCGFTLAPLNPARPEDADYTRRMMSKVEGMSLVALEEGAPWNWHSFGDYLDALEGRIAVNAGFMVGHCAWRYVMGADAVGSRAGEQVDDTRLSTRRWRREPGACRPPSPPPTPTATGNRSPPRHAKPAELLALSRAVRRARGHPDRGDRRRLDQFSDDEIDLFVEMSAAAGRPLDAGTC